MGDPGGRAHSGERMSSSIRHSVIDGLELEIWWIHSKKEEVYTSEGHTIIWKGAIKWEEERL